MKLENLKKKKNHIQSPNYLNSISKFSTGEGNSLTSITTLSLPKEKGQKHLLKLPTHTDM